MNLLRGQRDSQSSAALATGGPSAFSSRREVWLASALLVLGGAILWFVFSGDVQLGLPKPAEEAPAETIADDAPPPVPSAGEAAPPPEASGIELAAESPREQLTPAVSTGAGAPRPATAIPAAVASATPAVSRQPPRTAVPATPAPTPPGQAATLREVTVSDNDGALRIFITTGNRPQYTMFRADNPSRVVIDLPNLRHSLPRPERERNLSHPKVQTIRIAQNQLDPPKVRIVLDVASFPDLQILPRSNGLEINVGGDTQ